MPTHYNIRFMAAHPVSMTFGPPENGSVLAAIESALEDQGMVPLAAQSERGDDPSLFTEHEGKTWIHNAPDDLILAVAKMLDGFVAQALDAESDIEAPIYDDASSTYVAEAFLEYRKKATS